MLILCYRVSSEHTKVKVRDFYQFQRDEFEFDPILVYSSQFSSNNYFILYKFGK